MATVPELLERRRWILLTAAFMLAACGGGGSGDAGGGTANRCESVPAAAVDAIEAGMTVSGGGSLSRAQAVRSNDFEKVWFVAAEIDGPGMEGAGDIGVWVTNDVNGGGTIGAVDGFAHQFSDWGVRSDVSRSDDGYSEARACLE